MGGRPKNPNQSNIPKELEPILKMVQVNSEGHEFPVANKVTEIRYIRATSGVMDKYPDKGQVVITLVGEDTLTHEPMTFTGYLDAQDSMELVKLVRKCIADIPTHLR